LPTTVTDEMVAELDAELGHDGLVELTYAIAVENHRARFNHALGITDQGSPPSRHAVCRLMCECAGHQRPEEQADGGPHHQLGAQ
jgi:hypothetical protein